MDWTLSGRDKRIILYVRSISGLLTVVKKKLIPPNVSHIKYGKDKSFTFDVGRPIYRSGNALFYVVDVLKGQQFLTEPKSEIAPELLHAVMAREMGKQLLTSVEPVSGWHNIMFVIIGVLIALPSGILVGMLV